MSRAAVVIISPGNEVALIERHRQGSTYYVFPGGGIHEDETPSQAAGREAFEELGVHVQVGPLLAEVTFRGNHQYYFQATIATGSFGSGTPGSHDEPEAGTYAAVWKPLRTIQNLDVRPSALAQALSEIALSGPPAGPIRIVEG